MAVGMVNFSKDGSLTLISPLGPVKLLGGSCLAGMTLGRI